LAPNDRDAYIPTYLQAANNDPERATKLIESQTKDLMCYLWDNYLDGYASNSIVLMGVGDAYLGVKQLLINRGISHLTRPLPYTILTKIDCRHKIGCIVSFVSGTLRPVKSETDPQLSNWYKTNSLIYVSPDHSCWSDPEAAKKVRKSRFGGVIKSEVPGLEAMMNRYKSEAGKWIEQKLKDRWLALGLGENGEGVVEGEGDTTEEEVERRPVVVGPRGW
jgi:histone deacetylase 6